MKKWEVSRRHFLRSSVRSASGLMLGLPLLEAMMPSMRRANASGSLVAPVRYIQILIPNGVHIMRWNETTTGTNSTFTLGSLLTGFSSLKADGTIFKGLDNVPSYGGPTQPPGAHGRSPAAITTGKVPARTNVLSQINVGGKSFDQNLATAFGDLTPNGSIQMATSNFAGDSDSYHLEYQNLSWISATQHADKLLAPGDVFDRLFTGFSSDTGSADFLKEKSRKLSLLDYLLTDVAALKAKVGKSDKNKIEEYLQSIRDIETQINAIQPPPDTCTVPTKPNGYTASGTGVGLYVRGPDNQRVRLDTHLKLFFDMMTVAMQCDSTRIFTVLVEGCGSNRDFSREIGPGYSGEWHGTYSHHGCRFTANGANYNLTQPAWDGSIATATQASNLAKYGDINKFVYDQIAYLITKLKTTSEGEANLLHNSVVLTTNELGDGNSHSDDNIPAMVHGNAGGLINHHGGQCVGYYGYPGEWSGGYTANTTRLSNLYVDLQQKIASRTLAGLSSDHPQYSTIQAACQALATATSFGDSNGRLTALD